ncbi:glycosyltransferase family 4 protein [Micrococcus terreus]|uniref:glycosyltransferase family 4 protein n=1 Tax=Micrococcus terreus TaxID=574650 RepID=UPI0021A4BA8D|nr:glycosyltransferase family 4 protein [Micrococcus terreus]MCT2089341.1 glycosyltransferase family 4 protein [Micrococcus terreus]
MVVQPTVSHYRAPFIQAMLQQDILPVSLFGRYSNLEDRHLRNQIKSASAKILQQVEELRFREWNHLRWERGIVPSVVRREYSAYVLEGRAYTVSTWLALLLGKAQGTPIFLWGHGWKRPESGAKLAFRIFFYKLARGLLVYGDWAKGYAESVGLDPQRVAVVGNSIFSEDDLRRNRVPERTGQESDFTVIVSVRLTSRHRVHLLAEAMERMPQGTRNTRVIIIGDGDQRERLEQEFSSRGIPAEFPGAVYGAGPLSDYYRRSDVAVSPRASGLNIVQAMGFGRPVIAPTDDPTSGPESELAVAGETGLRFALDDVDALAGVLVQLRDQPAMAVSMGRAAFDRVLRTHTADAHSRAMAGAVRSRLE